ncbi:hypothetical protein R6Q57_013046 [Mikania cordata]
MASTKVKDLVSTSPVVVFSKSYCPFCVNVKKLLTELGSSFKTIELDQESDGSEMQSALHEWTGQRTVPNVFIAGKHIGGCDSKGFHSSCFTCFHVQCYTTISYSGTIAMHKAGKLVPALTEAKAIAA